MYYRIEGFETERLRYCFKILVFIKGVRYSIGVRTVLFIKCIQPINRQYYLIGSPARYMQHMYMLSLQFGRLTATCILYKSLLALLHGPKALCTNTEGTLLEEVRVL